MVRPLNLKPGNASQKLRLTAVGWMSNRMMKIPCASESGFGMPADGDERGITKLILQTRQEGHPGIPLDWKVAAV